jgi:hypothetical protein
MGGEQLQNIKELLLRANPYFRALRGSLERLNMFIFFDAFFGIN